MKTFVLSQCEVSEGGSPVLVVTARNWEGALEKLGAKEDGTGCVTIDENKAIELGLTPLPTIVDFWKLEQVRSI